MYCIIAARILNQEYVIGVIFLFVFLTDIQMENYPIHCSFYSIHSDLQKVKISVGPTGW